MVIIETNKGNITIELYKDKAPKTVANFLEYCELGFYNGLIFHRVIKGFMIQGGGLDSEMDHKEGNPSIENEADNGLKNDKYTIAMARTNAPHSATSQFFINTNDNDFLNHTSKTLDGWGYCVFGKVIKGQEVVDEIEKVKTTRVGMYRDVPSENIIITNVTVE